MPKGRGGGGGGVGVSQPQYQEQDYEELRELLNSWNVGELLPHFQDEAINVEELQMLKRHHLNELMGHFRYGTRIRFEHHLERWRHWMNVPLMGSPSEAAGHCSGCRCSTATVSSAAAAVAAASNAGTIGVCQPQITSVRSVENPMVVATKPEESLNSRNVEPLVSLNETCDSNSFNMTPLTDHTELVHTTLGGGSGTLKQEREGSEPDASEEGAVTVLGILQVSGIKAQSLLERLGQNEQLDAVQRLLLIQLICSYYEDNQLHLTLQRSHLLEREILELFPKEQLHFYRTERRGKIYVRFTNMKRNKRFSTQRAAAGGAGGGSVDKRRKEDPSLKASTLNNSYVTKGVSFAGDAMSSPERSD
ncbi:uncharacterized protein Dwil_GK21493 [Drosophila willistoni]|uniref:GK21493 n=1 Tax=Drosophila willistoni TaxID=7260 RepID=B4MQ43_DROWI|nr:uncharacterized protein LOC6640531 [Drosophila willistoni]EDW74232.1 uncharacterized protein Dwil_GK21493 [Drosophila willistoni]